MDYITTDTELTLVANAIRAKGRTSNQLVYPNGFVSAIDDISGDGIELTSADEGKVVVESDNEYVLQSQTSRTVTVNGTYDTTTNDEVVVNVSGGVSPVILARSARVLDDSDNGSTTLPFSQDLLSPQDLIFSEEGYSFVFLFADNQTTNITINGVVYAASDITIATGWNGDNVYAFAGETESFQIALNAGDGGNHACTFLAINDVFETSYTQTFARATTASQTIEDSLSEAFVLLLFCVYGGGVTASITFMGVSVSVNRYASRYGNSIYAYATKLEDLSAGDVVDVTIDATAANVIGIMGIFGNFR